jgi:DNA-binding GntR family transcriptional regulator
MRDNIRAVLVARILDGTYPAGTQLKELYLAREFDVSQAPIREALRDLEGSGLVTCERFRGTRVRGADFSEMRESYELRTMLEVRAVTLAAPYKPEVLADLADFLQQMDAAVKQGDAEGYIDNALRFHRRLVQSSGNRAFLSVWDALLWDVRGRIALRRLAEMGKSLKSLVSMHRALMSRLRAQDAAGAALRVRKILERVSSAFAERP